MRRMFLMSSVLLAAPFYAGTAGAEVCIAEEDCNNLGYTEDKACRDGVKCPFGEKWLCLERCLEGQVRKDGKCVDIFSGSCSGMAKNCKIGQILNNDGSCSDDKVSGKTPLGVVVYIDDGCGYAITDSPIAINIKWSTEYADTGTFQSTSRTKAINDFDVNGNMTKIIQYTENKYGDKAADYYPAVYAALNYAPSGAPTTKGKWALPSAGILNSLYTNLSTINNTISKLIGIKLTTDGASWSHTNDEQIWSSSEYSSEKMWRFCPSCDNYGGVMYYSKDATSSGGYFAVRPVLAF